MKYKLTLFLTCILFIFSTISIFAVTIPPSAKLTIDNTNVSINGNIDAKISGTISRAFGQKLVVRDSKDIPILLTDLPNANGNSSKFNFIIKASYIKMGTNKYTVQSLNFKDKVVASRITPITIIKSKGNQVITATDKNIETGKSVNIGAKVNSNLPLSYMSKNTSIATVDGKGKITGKKAGTTSIDIVQNGNEDWNKITKTIKVTIKDVPSTYTVVFKANGGSGSMSSQKITVGKSVKLSANKFKRTGYKFVGWATESTKASYKSGQHIENFKNVNMQHFQLGKVKYKNTASVKNLASKGKTITLYAVWKGNGPQAAVDWATLIAADNNFTYGTPNRSYRTGCYFCGTNRDKFNGRYHGKESKKWNTNKNYLSAQSTAQKYDKTWCCNPFVVACYVHGANEHSKCHGGNMTISSWTNNKNNGRFKEISKNASLQPGDIFISQSHVWICGNKNKKGQWTLIDASKGDWSASSIAVRTINPKTYRNLSIKGRIRYYPNN